MPQMPSRQDAYDGDQRRAAARRSTPEEIAASRERVRARLRPSRSSELESLGNDLGGEWVDQPTRDHPDPEMRLSERERPRFASAKALPGQFAGLGQPALAKEGEFYSENRHGYDTETQSFGWRSASPDVNRVPFHPSARRRDYMSENAATVSMSRRMDEHYVLSDANTDDWYEEREDGHHQGILLESEKAKPWKVNEMYSTKGGRHMANVLLGLAAQHSMQTSGQFPKASKDLSVHSTRIVHGLADKGIIDAPKDEHRNNIDWEHGAQSARATVDYNAMYTRDGYAGNRQLSTQEGLFGGRVMRQVLRGARTTPVERGLPEPQPPVNARSQAGRFQEFTHQQRLREKYDKPRPAQPPSSQGTLF